MKKFLTIILSLLCITGFSQGSWESIYKVTDVTAAFGRGLEADQLVHVTDSSKLYSLSRAVTKSNTMTEIFADPTWYAAGIVYYSIDSATFTKLFGDSAGFYSVYIRDSLSLAGNAELYFGADETITRKNANGLQTSGSWTVGASDTLFLGTQYLWSPNTNTIQGEGSIKTGTSDTLFSGVLSVAGNADVVSALTAGTVASDATVTATTSFNVGSQTISQGTVNRLDFNNSTSTADTAFLGDRTTYLKQDLLRMGNSGTITIGEQTLTRKNTNGVTWNNSITATDSIFAAMLKASGQMSTGTNAGTSGQINFTASDNDQLNLAISTSDALDLNGGDFTIDATQKIYLDGGSDTYDAETSADVRDTYVGGVNMIKVTEGTGIDAVRILNAPLQVDSSIRMSQLSAAPTKPAAGNTRIYADNTGNLDIQDPNGVVRGTAWTPPLKGLTFDGVDDKVTATGFSISGTSTYCMIIKTSSSSAIRLIEVLGGGLYRNMSMYTGGIFSLYDGTNEIRGTRAFNDGKIHLLTVTYNTNDVHLYIDGVEDTKSLGSTFVLNTISAGTIGIGSTYAGGTYFTGNIYDTKIYNRALTAAEVLTMWNDGQPSLYQVPYADKGGSQTNRAVNGTFTGSATGWSLGTGWAYGTNEAVATTASDVLYQAHGMSVGKRVRVSYTITRTAGSVTIYAGGSAGATRSSNGTYVDEIILGTGTNISFSGSGFTGTLDDVLYYQIGNVADYQGEWAGSTSWVDKSGNNLNGITSGSPVLTIPLPECQYSVSQIFTTGIAASPKVLVIPSGYEVTSIYIQDMGTAGGLSGISATQETSGITLIAGKAVATGTGITFRTIADHNVYSTNKNLSFLATGNGSSGMRIVTTLKRVN